MKHQNSLRIIGGKWRSRKVSFADRKEIRPTGDRVRETLFNWLMHDVTGARCLDLFAGSGILGIEALSRGAAAVSFVEKESEIGRQIESNLATLGAENADLTVTTAEKYLHATRDPYDLIFLDPPFDSSYLQKTLNQITELGVSGGLIYIESESDSIFDDLAGDWQILRQKRAGNVSFGLIRTP